MATEQPSFAESRGPSERARCPNCNQHELVDRLRELLRQTMQRAGGAGDSDSLRHVTQSPPYSFGGRADPQRGQWQGQSGTTPVSHGSQSSGRNGPCVIYAERNDEAVFECPNVDTAVYLNRGVRLVLCGQHATYGDPERFDPAWFEGGS